MVCAINIENLYSIKKTVHIPMIYSQLIIDQTLVEVITNTIIWSYSLRDKLFNFLLASLWATNTLITKFYDNVSRNLLFIFLLDKVGLHSIIRFIHTPRSSILFHINPPETTLLCMYCFPCSGIWQLP